MSSINNKPLAAPQSLALLQGETKISEAKSHLIILQAKVTDAVARSIKTGFSNLVASTFSAKMQMNQVAEHLRQGFQTIANFSKGLSEQIKNITNSFTLAAKPRHQDSNPGTSSWHSNLTYSSDDKVISRARTEVAIGQPQPQETRKREITAIPINYADKLPEPNPAAIAGTLQNLVVRSWADKAVLGPRTEEGTKPDRRHDIAFQKFSSTINETGKQLLKDPQLTSAQQSAVEQTLQIFSKLDFLHQEFVGDTELSGKIHTENALFSSEEKKKITAFRNEILELKSAMNALQEPLKSIKSPLNPILSGYVTTVLIGVANAADKVAQQSK